MSPCPALPVPDQESEGEEAAEARVALAQDMGRGNLASRNSRVRLQEVCCPELCNFIRKPRTPKKAPKTTSEYSLISILHAYAF